METWRRVVGAVARDRRIKTGLILLVAVAVYWFLLRLPRPPGPGIVATYLDGQVTKEELRHYLHEFLPRCSKHARCRLHGEDHEDCDAGEPCELFLDCFVGEHIGIHQPPLYRRAATALVVDRLIAKRVAKEKLAERGEIRHLMKHVDEEVSLADLDQTLHATEMRIEATGVRECYEKNRSQFGGQTLSEVAPQIEEILSRQKEKDFVEDYVRRLREESVAFVNYELLQWPEPSEGDLELLFAEKARDLVRPGRSRVLLVSLRTDSGNSGERVEEARSLLLAGATEEQVADAFQEAEGTVVSVQWIEEESDLAWVLQLPRRVPGDVTDIVDHKGVRYVGRVLEREARRELSFEEAEPLPEGQVG